MSGMLDFRYPVSGFGFPDTRNRIPDTQKKFTKKIKTMKGNLILLAILLLLGGIFGFFLMNKGKDDSTFRSQLVEINADAVDKMEVIIPGKPSMHFTKKDDAWFVNDGGEDQKTKDGMFKMILSEFSKLKAARVAGLDSEKWEALEVTDETATRLKIWEGSKQTCDLYIGKFEMKQAPPGQAPQGMPGQQPQPQFSNYVRVAGDQKTYLVNEMLKPQFSQSIENLIDAPPPPVLEETLEESETME